MFFEVLLQIIGLFKIKDTFQILVLGTPEGYPALDPLIFMTVDSKLGMMTQSTGHLSLPPPRQRGPTRTPTIDPSNLRLGETDGFCIRMLLGSYN